jgi:hypothetical protein
MAFGGLINAFDEQFLDMKLLHKNVPKENLKIGK